MSTSNRQTSKLKAALEALQRLGVNARGPFVTPKQNRIYVADYCVLTQAEVVAAFHGNGRLKPEGITQFLAHLRRTQHQTSSPVDHRRRSQRVVLRLGVLVRFDLDEGQRQTHALAVTVNAHGGLMESPFRMTTGQRAALINPQNGKEVGCTVVSVQASSEGYFEIAFEFTQPSPSFWEIAFPPSDWRISEESA